MSIKDHPNYNTLTTLVESLITKIRNAQADYFVKKGRYFQGLRTPTADCDGIESKDVAYGKHPSDQEDSWNTFDETNWKDGTKLPFNISIDVYEAPTGWGWILMIEFWKEGLGPDNYGSEGDHWMYVHSEGPENWSDVEDEWFIFVEDEEQARV